MIIRKNRPGYGDKYFIRKISGGYSSCIVGRPKDTTCDVLANCVGYANGAFNETCGNGFEKYYLNCNAENFIERAISLGLKVVQEPTLGGIMVWAKGKVGVSSDGAGHVEHVVETVNKDTAENRASNYDGTAFYKVTRKRGDGNWGMKAPYWYRGCIVNPKVGYKPYAPPTPTPPIPTPGAKFKIGDKVIVNGELYKSSNAAYPVGQVKNKSTIITRVAEGAAHPYNTTGDLGWMNEVNIQLVTNTPSPTQKPLEKGSTVLVTGRWYASSRGGKYGVAPANFKGKISIINKGSKYPYHITDMNGGAKGWVAESQLKGV